MDSLGVNPPMDYFYKAKNIEDCTVEELREGYRHLADALTAERDYARSNAETEALLMEALKELAPRR